MFPKTLRGSYGVFFFDFCQYSAAIFPVFFKRDDKCGYFPWLFHGFSMAFHGFFKRDDKCGYFPWLFHGFSWLFYVVAKTPLYSLPGVLSKSLIAQLHVERVFGTRYSRRPGFIVWTDCRCFEGVLNSGRRGKKRKMLSQTFSQFRKSFSIERCVARLGSARTRYLSNDSTALIQLHVSPHALKLFFRHNVFDKEWMLCMFFSSSKLKSTTRSSRISFPPRILLTTSNAVSSTDKALLHVDKWPKMNVILRCGVLCCAFWSAGAAMWKVNGTISHCTHKMAFFLFDNPRWCFFPLCGVVIFRHFPLIFSGQGAGPIGGSVADYYDQAFGFVTFCAVFCSFSVFFWIFEFFF